MNSLQFIVASHRPDGECVASKAYNMFLCYIAGKRINTHDVVHDGSKNVEYLFRCFYFEVRAASNITSC